MNSKSNAQAMETEKISRLLARLAIPAVVAQIINLLYNIVDRIYIGHIPGVGAAALTGVGLFTPILMLINAFAMLAGSGGAPRAAISMGKKDNKTAIATDTILNQKGKDVICRSSLTQESAARLRHVRLWKWERLPLWQIQQSRQPETCRLWQRHLKRQSKQDEAPTFPVWEDRSKEEQVHHHR